MNILFDCVFEFSELDPCVVSSDPVLRPFVISVFGAQLQSSSMINRLFRQGEYQHVALVKLLLTHLLARAASSWVMCIVAKKV